MRNLRDQAEKQTMADLEAVRKIRDEVLACRAETLLHRNETSVYWDETLLHRNEAEAYRNDTLAHRDETMVHCNATLANIAARGEEMAAHNTAAAEVCPLILCATNNNVIVDRPQTTPVLTSLKRKRDDTDENEAEAEGQSESDVLEKEAAKTVAVAVGTDGADVDDVVMKEEAPLANSSSSSTTSKPTPTPAVPADVPRRPRKRARKFTKAFVQTATAVTLGAVVTWSALAFS